MLFSELKVGEFFYHVTKDALLFKIEHLYTDSGFDFNAIVISGKHKGSPTSIGLAWEVEPVAYTKKQIVAGVFNNYGDFNM